MDMRKDAPGPQRQHISKSKQSPTRVPPTRTRFAEAVALGSSLGRHCSSNQTLWTCAQGLASQPTPGLLAVQRTAASWAEAMESLPDKPGKLFQQLLSSRSLASNPHCAVGRRQHKQGGF